MVVCIRDLLSNTAAASYRDVDIFTFGYQTPGEMIANRDTWSMDAVSMDIGRIPPAPATSGLGFMQTQIIMVQVLGLSWIVSNQKKQLKVYVFNLNKYFQISCGFDTEALGPKKLGPKERYLAGQIRNNGQTKSQEITAGRR